MRAGPGWPASSGGTIVGVVTDRSTGQPLGGATVWIASTARPVTADMGGHYRIGDLRVGRHTVKARYIGYEADSVTVQVSFPVVTADVALARSEQMLAEVVTTGTFVPRNVRELATPITVITAEAIAQQRPQALVDLIRQAVPTAVGFERPSGSSSQTFFSVRGVSSLSGSSPLKILLDGIEVTSFTLSPVDPKSIERIEVVRGPQAGTIFGADAAGGVIQIFTKRGDSSLVSPQVTVEAGLGVLQTPYAGHRGVLRQEYTGAVQGGVQSITYHLGGGYTHLDDFVPTGDPSRQSIPSLYGGLQFRRGFVTVDVSGRYYRNRIPATLNPDILRSGFTPLSQPLYEMNDQTNEALGARVLVTPVSWLRHQTAVGIDRQALSAFQTRRRFTTPSRHSARLAQQPISQAVLLLECHGAACSIPADRWVSDLRARSLRVVGRRLSHHQCPEFRWSHRHESAGLVRAESIKNTEHGILRSRARSAFARSFSLRRR